MDVKPGNNKRQAEADNAVDPGVESKAWNYGPTTAQGNISKAPACYAYVGEKPVEKLSQMRGVDPDSNLFKRKSFVCLRSGTAKLTT